MQNIVTYIATGWLISKKPKLHIIIFQEQNNISIVQHFFALKRSPRSGILTSFHFHGG
jgi:hypothetical protein